MMTFRVNTTPKSASPSLPTPVVMFAGTRADSSRRRGDAMKLVLSVSLLIVANVCLAQTNPPPDKAQASELPDKITIDSVTYENVRWQKPTPSSVEIFHKSGIASIPLSKLPPELQERFGYDPQKATAYSTAEAAARSKQAELNRQAAAKQKERAQVEQQEAAQREWADTVARKEQPRFRNVNGTVYDFAAAIELARKKEPGASRPDTMGCARLVETNRNGYKI
jgi:hypothetical protein